ncbi:MAG: hypothetical protein ABIU05_27060 [Nitrospirales bacterium]
MPDRALQKQPDWLTALQEAADHEDDRTYLREGLKRRSPDYRILEATDGE